MHEQTERLFYNDEKFHPDNVFGPTMRIPRDRDDDDHVMWDPITDEFRDWADLDELVEWMWEAEKEVCESHGEVVEGHFDTLDQAAKHYIDYRIYEDANEYVNANVDVVAFANALQLDTHMVHRRFRHIVIDSVERRLKQQGRL